MKTKLTEDTHVYCTQCINGETLLQALYEDKHRPSPCDDCDPYDPEDSRPYKTRPHYQPDITY